MGSLVISQVAPGIAHTPYTTMRRGEAHQTPEFDSAPRGSRPESRSQSTTSNGPSAVARPTSTETPVVPPSPSLPPENAPSHTRSSNATPVPSSRPSNQTPTDQSQMSRPHPSQFHSSHSQYVNQHPHGFDQSGFPLTSAPRGLASSSPNSPRLQPTYRSTHSLGGSEASSPSRIKVRDLSHIQSFASEELLARPRIGQRTGSGVHDAGRQYEISSMPVTDIIEMVAGLLTKITTTNDQQHEHLHRHVPPPEGTPGLSQQTTSVLAFHGKNVPSITILSYLSRIHKYCPTTYEVFLSLLVYFDRMTEMVNSGYIRSMQQRTDRTLSQTSDQPPSSPMPMVVDEETSNTSRSAVATPPSSTPMEGQDPAPGHSSIPSSPLLPEDQTNLAHFFVVDSFNIHRLVIAGVTCASKFFSDVFYTNSRYAKVGGLPLNELNHLELQFLHLNDFRLSVPVEELEAYGTMLVEFYAREVVAQQQYVQMQHAQQLSGSHGEGMYMRGPGGAGQTPTPP